MEHAQKFMKYAAGILRIKNPYTKQIRIIRQQTLITIKLYRV